MSVMEDMFLRSMYFPKNPVSLSPPKWYRQLPFPGFGTWTIKRYLNEKNLMHGRVMATISKFSPQIFETYFR